MAKSCDICGGKIGWKAFHCQDGRLCKKCYCVVSNHFTAIITHHTLQELRALYEKNTASIELGEDGFQTTRKIGTVLLLDEGRKKFCIPSNRSITKTYARPEVFSYDELCGYKLMTDPALPPEKLAGIAADRNSMAVVRKLWIRLRLANDNTKDLVIVPSPVRCSSYAFRKSYQIAMDVFREFDDIYQSQRS